MSDIEGAICDECGNKIGPMGCCATLRGRTEELPKSWGRERNKGKVVKMEKTIWVYEMTETSPNWLWTVGFYDPKGIWHGDSDHADREEAAKRVHYLNGGN